MTDIAARKDIELENDTATLSPEESRYLYDMRQKALWDYESGMYSARQEGREEGRAEGIEEGEARGIVKGRAEERMTNARNLVQNHVPVDVIQKSLSLTDEEVKKLLS